VWVDHAELRGDGVVSRLREIDLAKARGATRVSRLREIDLAEARDAEARRERRRACRARVPTSRDGHTERQHRRRRGHLDPDSGLRSPRRPWIVGRGERRTLFRLRARPGVPLLAGSVGHSAGSASMRPRLATSVVLSAVTASSLAADRRPGQASASRAAIPTLVRISERRQSLSGRRRPRRGTATRAPRARRRGRCRAAPGPAGARARTKVCASSTATVSARRG